MRRVALIVAIVLVLAPKALAGGDFVDLAVHGSTVWFVGEFGVRGLDARTGGTVAAPALVQASYPLSVAVAGGAVWVASVENGYVDGKLTRIDLRTGRKQVVLREPPGSVQYVAAGAGGMYALLGVPGGNDVVRLNYRGRVVRRWRIADAGRMAADAVGCWVAGNGRLLHIDPRGRVHVAARIAFGDVATGGGAVWVGLSRSILRLDERTGRTQTLRTGRLHLGGFQHDLAFAAGALWTLGSRTLERRDASTGRRTASVRLPGFGDAIAVTPTAIFVGVVVAAPNTVASAYDVVRVDPTTLRRRVLVHLAA